MVPIYFLICMFFLLIHILRRFFKILRRRVSACLQLLDALRLGTNMQDIYLYLGWVTLPMLAKYKNKYTYKAYFGPLFYPSSAMLAADIFHV